MAEPGGIGVTPLEAAAYVVHELRLADETSSADVAHAAVVAFLKAKGATVDRGSPAWFVIVNMLSEIRRTNPPAA